jgi:hypothetical protein
VATELGLEGKIAIQAFSAGCKFIFDAVGYTL